eukprot:8183678-Pyramimonas_sp.AAC.1
MCNTTPVYTSASVHISACARHSGCLHRSIRVQGSAGVHHGACVHRTGKKEHVREDLLRATRRH